MPFNIEREARIFSNKVSPRILAVGVLGALLTALAAAESFSNNLMYLVVGTTSTVPELTQLTFAANRKFNRLFPDNDPPNTSNTNDLEDMLDLQASET